MTKLMKRDAKELARAIPVESIDRRLVPVGEIDPDPRNRRVVDDQDLDGLADSIRVLGLLQPVHLQPQPDGRYRIIDGERRWRAAQRAGLPEIPCDVWPASADSRDAALAGLVLNEQRKAAGCVQVARRLRDIKNESGLTHEELARRCGLPLDRVKSYFSLFGASDFLIQLCETRDVPLKIAVALIRYERATNEGKAKQLAKRYADEGLTCREIDATRKRAELRSEPGSADKTTRRRTMPAAHWLATRFEAEYQRDQATALAELTRLVGRLGYRLVPATETGQ